MLDRLRTLIVLAFVALGTFSLTACNTVEGAGDDLKEASENTRDAIEDATD